MPRRPRAIFSCDGQPREQAVLLVDRPHAAARRDRARRRGERARQDVQQRRLAAARGADERDELPRRDIERDVLPAPARAPKAQRDAGEAQDRVYRS